MPTSHASLSMKWSSCISTHNLYRIMNGRDNLIIMYIMYCMSNYEYIKELIDRGKYDILKSDKQTWNYVISYLYNSQQYNYLHLIYIFQTPASQEWKELWSLFLHHLVALIKLILITYQIQSHCIKFHQRYIGTKMWHHLIIAIIRHLYQISDNYLKQWGFKGILLLLSIFRHLPPLFFQNWQSQVIIGHLCNP